ncbi:glutamine amidotransferase [Cardiobacteriaceae bacterium TAE3-ERU3]|nr:glutamine amidotransferase [Cardiobacteriaceae bacterium TAE3-ERU3]
MKTALVIRHLHFEDLGIIAGVLHEQGYQVRYVEAGLCDFCALDPVADDLLIILGGPIGAYEEAAYPFLRDELGFIEQRLQANKAMLGVCLGAQLIARLLGAKVKSMGHKEIGFAPLQLNEEVQNNPLAGLADVPVLHWHGDQFAIPDGAAHLAASAACPNQAFSYGENVLALQFHLEADPHKLEQWLIGHACELAQAGIDLQRLRDDAQQYGAALTAAGEQVMMSWFAGI